MIGKSLLSVAFGLLVLGCACPEKAVLRESMYQGVRTERQFAKDTAAKLVIDPTTGKDHRDQLQSLTPEQHQNLLKTDQEFEDLYNEDKAKDFKIGGQ